MAGPIGNSPYEVPDGGWGWMVCFASFTLQALTIGITYTFGIIFVDLLAYFKASESVAAWIGSIQPALLYFTGLIAGPMITRLGWRKVAIFGSILSTIGFGTSALAPNIYLLYLTYGVLTGIGNGCMYVTSMVCVQHYFSSRRAMATGLAVSGSGVGLIIFGVLSPALLSYVGWRWTLVVNAGIMLVVGCACGALYRPLPLTNKHQEDDDKTPLVRNDDASSSQRGSWQGDLATFEKSQLYGSVQVDSEVRKPVPISPIKERSESKDDSFNYNTPASSSESFVTQCRNLRCVVVLREIFDLSLFCNPIFTIFGFSSMLFGFGYHVPYTYTPERAMLLGISQKKASFLISIMGIANIGFRLLLGWVADKSSNLRFYFAGVVLCLGGVLNILVVFFDTYPLLIVYSVLFGAFSGSFVSLFPVILVDLLGLANLEKSMGQMLAMSSVAFLFAAPMSGFIIDKTGSLVIPFYVVGAAELAGGLAYFFIKLLIPHYGIESQLTIEDRKTLARRKRRSSSMRISELFS